jgi:ATP-dependent helicase/nuclease subunit A
MEPHIANAGSWWQRLEALAADTIVEAVVAAGVGPTAPTATLELNDGAELETCPITLKILPNRPLAPVEYAQAAIKNIASLEVTDTTDSRLGQAMHRLLEWVSPAPGGVGTAPWTAAQLGRAQIEFALDSAQINTAAAMALGILRGEGAWAWDATQLRWWGNEVPMVQRGRTIRLDRLVQQGASGEWWILDYKSASRPQDQPELLAQLGSYRNAVRQATPGQIVRAAFLTPQGTLIE